MKDKDSRPTEIWNQNNSKWEGCDFDTLEPGDIVRFDLNDDCVYRVISFPFLSTKYSLNGDPVGTIISSESLYWYEND